MSDPGLKLQGVTLGSSVINFFKMRVKLNVKNKLMTTGQPTSFKQEEAG